MISRSWTYVASSSDPILLHHHHQEFDKTWQQELSCFESRPLLHIPPILVRKYWWLPIVKLKNGKVHVCVCVCVCFSKGAARIYLRWMLLFVNLCLKLLHPFAISCAIAVVTFPTPRLVFSHQWLKISASCQAASTAPTNQPTHLEMLPLLTPRNAHLLISTLRPAWAAEHVGNCLASHAWIYHQRWLWSLANHSHGIFVKQCDQFIRILVDIGWLFLHP